MKKYNVVVFYTTCSEVTLEVEAEDEQQARKKALKFEGEVIIEKEDDDIPCVDSIEELTGGDL